MLSDLARIKSSQKMDELEREIARLKAELNSTQQALISASNVKVALAHQCKRLIENLSDDECAAREQACLQFTLDEDWLMPLRKDAFHHGFKAGYMSARLSSKSDNESVDKAYEHYQAGNDAYSVAKIYASPLRAARPRHSDVLRYRFDPEKQRDPFFIDDNGEYVDYSAYAELKFCFNMMKNERLAYVRMLQDPMAVALTPNQVYQAAKGFVRRPQKSGVLKIQYGKNGGERDLFVLYGSTVPACDRALMMHAFTSKQMYFDYDKRQPAFSPSLVEELAARGYDLSTLRFQVTKAAKEADA